MDRVIRALPFNVSNKAHTVHNKKCSFVMCFHMTNEQTLFLIVSHYLYISSGVVIAVGNDRFHSTLHSLSSRK